MSRILTHGIIVAVVLGTLAIITIGLLRPAPSINSQGVRSAAAGTPQVGLQRGDMAPNFTLKTLDGRRVSLSDYRGRPVMLNFWMIHCDGCQYEMPGMQKVYAGEQAGHKDLVMLGINAVDGVSDMRQFVRQRGFTYPMLMDAHAYVEQLYALRGTPTSYFIDRKGLISASNEGGLDEGELRRLIQQMEAP